MSYSGTKSKLISFIEDVEIITKELFDALASNREGRAEQVDPSKLIDLLVHKDQEIQSALTVAKQQAEIQKEILSLTGEVEKRDTEIKLLQQQLKEAETMLSTAIYQAKMKLKLVKQGENNKVSTEELIKYAHKISASNAVAAPPGWMPGDPRRPYPVDVEMRMGHLAALGTPALHELSVQHLSSQESAVATSKPAAALGEVRGTVNGASSSLSWQQAPSDDKLMSGLQTSPRGGHDASVKPVTDEVEVMSSDSSSSSSSDE